MLTNSFAELTRQRAVMRMWFSRRLGTTGKQMLMVSASWQMDELTGSAWDLGLVGLHKFAPALLSLPAGAAFVWRRKALPGVVELELFAVLLGGATAALPGPVGSVVAALWLKGFPALAHRDRMTDPPAPT